MTYSWNLSGLLERFASVRLRIIETVQIAAIERFECFDGSRTVSHPGVIRMCGNSDDTSAGQHGEVIVLILFI